MRKYFRWYYLLLPVCLLRLSDACGAQYRRELRYLDFYLGIAPANEEGSLYVNDALISRYVENSASLNCDLYTSCLWMNAPTDHLLDTSDFYLFNKTDRKSFPIQIRPGNANPTPGTFFLLAGNITSESQGAVLLSAPILCQNSDGLLTFEYWLYNSARVEVLLVRVNPDRGHLQVIARPPIDCHYLKTGPICRVEIRRTFEPFRIGIRAFSLRDAAVGSFAMINRIRYEADVCGVHDRTSLFDGTAITKWLRQRRPISTASDLNCGSEGKAEECLWAAASPSSTASVDSGQPWSIGRSTRLWDELVRTPNRPLGQFLFQAIDPMADLASLPQLRSVLVPCTQTPSSLSFKFWLSAGVQAQLCTLSTNNVALSCIYLNEIDSPGPVVIDVDTADHQPFRFAFSVIKFHQAQGGIIALDDIHYSGLLCHETPPTTAPAQPAPSLDTIFDLQPFPAPASATDSFSEQLDCDFETDLCSHWMHNDDYTSDHPQAVSPNRQFQFGFVQRNIMGLGRAFRGQSAIAIFPLSAVVSNGAEGDFAMLTSQQITCAERGRLVVSYYASEGASMTVCADDRCVAQRKPYGEMSVTLHSPEPFRIRILAKSKPNASAIDPPLTPFVLVKRIKASSGFCRLETPTELSCKTLTCDFREGDFCNYKSVTYDERDTSFHPQLNKGIVAVLSGTKRRAILLSPRFSLSSSAELRFEASLSTFGSTLHLCPGEYQQKDGNVAPDIENCELLLGPRIEQPQVESLLVQMDPDVRQFVFVAGHDKYEQFGEARAIISRIQLSDSNGDLIC
ncbi:MAM (Meprin, A5-protein, PTPmu) domain protein [Ditylenchus destructor]|nr:MAM (Meprin, A5-protein, PTPmu) domain protein [Ditylenchus destructor]